MPNHVHVLATPLTALPAHRIVCNIKRFTAHSIRQITPVQPLWQKDMFDHLVRNEDSFRKIVSYIADNPIHLPSTSFSLYVADDIKYLLQDKG